MVVLSQFSKGLGRSSRLDKQPLVKTKASEARRSRSVPVVCEDVEHEKQLTGYAQHMAALTEANVGSSPTS